MPTVGNLIVTLSASTTAFSKGMNDARKLAFDSSSSIVSSLGTIGDQIARLKFDNLSQAGKSLGKVGGIAAGAGLGVATAVVAVGHSVSETADEMNKLSQSYGLSVETISGLRVAAKMADLDLSQLTMGVGKMSKAAAAAAEQGKTLAGIKVTDQSGRPLETSELLLKMADRFAGLKDGVGKTALAMEVFGKAGAALIPFLNQGSAAIKETFEWSKKLGLSWSGNNAEAAAKFSDAIKWQELKVLALKEQIGRGALPAIDKLADEFLRVDSTGNSMAKTIGEGVGSTLLHVGRVADTLVVGFKMLHLRLIDIVELARAATNISPTNTVASWAAISAYLVGSEEREKQYDQLNDQWLDRMAKSYAPWNPPASLGKAGGGKDLVLGVANAAEPLAKAFVQLNQLSEKTRGLLNKEDADEIGTRMSNILDQMQKLQQFTQQNPGRIWTDANKQITELGSAVDNLRQKLLTDAPWVDSRGKKHEANLFPPDVASAMNQSGSKTMESVLSVPVPPALASAEAQAGASWIKFTQDINALNQEAARIYDQVATSGERWGAELTTLSFLQSVGSIDQTTYNRALERMKESINACYDPQMRYNELQREYNDLISRGLLTEAARVEMLRQMGDLQAEANARKGGVGTGIKSGLEIYGNQWQGMGVEGMNATIEALHGVNQAFRSAFHDMIMGTKSVGSAFAQLGVNIVDSIVSACGQVVANWFTMHVMMKLISKVFGDDGQDMAANQIKSNVAIAMSDAGLAAANTLALTSAMYPPPTPEILAAVTYGVGAGFAGLASAAGGWERVDRDQIAQVHKNEMVLPAPLAGVIRDLPRRSLNPFVSDSGNGNRNAGGQSHPPINIAFTINGAKDVDLIRSQVQSGVTAVLRRELRDRGYR